MRNDLQKFNLKKFSRKGSQALPHRIYNDLVGNGGFMVDRGISCHQLSEVSHLKEHLHMTQ